MAEARILYLATADGLVQLANPGRSDRWREVGRALASQSIRRVAAAPHDALQAVAATADALHRTMNGGASWDAIWQGMATALAYGAGNALYVGTAEGAVLRSLDGEQWEQVLNAEDTIRGVLVSQDGVVVAADAHNLHTLRATGPEQVQVCDAAAQVATIMAHPLGVEHQVLVICESSGDEASPDQPFLTGASVVLGGHEPVVLVGTHDAVLRSTQMTADEAVRSIMLGATQQAGFEPVAGPDQATTLVTPPRLLDQVFAGTARGDLWFSADRGRTWISLRQDVSPVHDLAFARAV